MVWMSLTLLLAMTLEDVAINPINQADRKSL